MHHAPGLNVWRDRVSVQCEVKNVLESGMEAVFRRFDEKYIRYLRTYLTEVLYNIKLHSPAFSVKKANRAQIAGWLRESPQGTAIAAASIEGARSVLAFLREERLTGRADAKTGRWSEDARAFNGVFLCPAGECPVRYERVILWDAPAAAFPGLPAGELYEPDERVSCGWLRELPDVNRLRELFVLVRGLTKSGALLRSSAADIDAELSRAAGGSWIEAMASLAALRSMGLIGAEKERLYMLPSHKTDPMNDVTFRKIQLLRDHAIGKG